MSHHPPDTLPEMASPVAIRTHERDTVAIVSTDMRAGDTVKIGESEIVLQDDIPAFHKLALVRHASGEAIIRFGEVIATATQTIIEGAHVHTHNATTTLSDALSYTYTEAAVLSATPAKGTFKGYRRIDGRVGTRNEIWIIPTVGCVAKASEEIARRAAPHASGKVDGIYAFPHVYGCSQLGDDLASTRQILASLINHPNAGGIVLIGLGCENNQSNQLLSLVSPDKASRVRTVISQMTADEIDDGVKAAQELIQLAATDARETCDVSDLVIGLKCGGSDALSGLTANPLLGRTTESVTAAGGGAILSEIPEIFGAEHLLMQRAKDETVFNGIVSLVNDFKNYFLSNGQKVHENPSPGNKAGGITTLEEKSLGAVQKAGQARVDSVCDYGMQAPATGLTLLEAPGNDAVSSTALVAAGATLVLFTTGRGTPLGFPVPTVKISSNADLATRKPNWIDFDASPMLSDNPAETESVFLDHLLKIASGEPTRNELNNERAIAIWKRGVTL